MIKKKGNNIFDQEISNRFFFLLIAIAICTASPMDPPPVSQFKQDYLRFWGTGDGKQKSVPNEIWTNLFVFVQLLNTWNRAIKLVGEFFFHRLNKMISCWFVTWRWIVLWIITAFFIKWPVAFILWSLRHPTVNSFCLFFKNQSIFNFFLQVNRIKMEYSSTQTPTEDFTTDQIQSILADARYQIEEEEMAMLSKNCSSDIFNREQLTLSTTISLI